MAKTTSAERMRALRERRAKDKEQYSEHLEKERIRDKKRRENTKNEAMTDTSLMKELRKRKTMAQRKWRAKAKAKTCNTPVSKLGSYQCPQSLGKAVQKIKKAVPNSPRKKIAVIKKLAVDHVPDSAKILFPQNEPPKSKISEETLKLVDAFYKSDDVSRQAPGIRDVKSVKDAVTGIRTRYQKRHMIVTVGEAYSLFVDENPGTQIGKSSFYDLRPKHVLLSSEMPHNVCVCKYHANMDFLLSSICNQVGPFNFPKTSEALLFCDITDEACMSGKCSQCMNDPKILIPEREFDYNKPVNYKQWTDKEGYPKVVDHKDTLGGALTKLQEDLPTFRTHFYVKRTQAKCFEEAKSSIKEDEFVLQIDFAAVTQDEIQSAHWSHKQISLFTACAWFNCDTSKSFVITSDELEHNKYTVFACLKKILWEARSKTCKDFFRRMRCTIQK